MVTKINLGCGPVGKEDWINIDWGILAFLHKYSIVERVLLKFKLFPKGYNVAWPKNLKLHNCKKRLPFADNSVDYIYTSHLLEHFKKFEAEEIVRDCYRLLKKGGIIRITVPDLELLVKKYLQKDIKYFKKITALMNLSKEKEEDAGEVLLTDILMDNFYPSFYKKKPTVATKLMSFFVRPHCWMYDYESLESLLKSAGFQNIKRRAFREGFAPDLDYLDVFPEMTLYVESEK